MLIEQLMDAMKVETGLHGTRVMFERRVGRASPVTEDYAAATQSTP
jgi:hypothetical protein